MLQDTSPEMEKLWNDLWLKKTPQERTRYGVGMFTLARKVIIASLPSDLSPNELKKQVFKRTYGYDLPEDFPFDEE